MLLQELFTVGIGFGSDNEGMCWKSHLQGNNPANDRRYSDDVQGEFGNPEVVFLSFEDYCSCTHARIIRKEK